MEDLLTRLNHPILLRIKDLLPPDLPIYLVGGAVRDAFIDRPVFDLDFVIAGDALKVGRNLANQLGGAYFPLDTARNVARIIVRPESVGEVSQLEPIKIDISRFQGADLASDLLVRDFTINAMAVDLHHPETVIDPLHGSEDLIHKRLRACSSKSFMSDPVRILRAVRFSVDLGMTILPETLAWMRDAIPYLVNVSPERVRDELFRMLAKAHPSTSIRILDKVGALEVVLPEVCFLKDVIQGPPHVLDVWGHTLDSLRRLEDLLDVLAPTSTAEKANNLNLGMVVLQLGHYRQHLADHLDSALNPDRPHRGLIFLACLYHDVGKLATRSINNDGTIRFINHAPQGSRMVEERAQALKLSNLEINRLVSIVNHHMRPSLLSHPEEPPSKKAVYHFFRDTGAAGVDICLFSLADVLATYGPTLPQDRWIRHLEVVGELLGAWWEEKDERVLPPAVVNGDDLQAELGVPQGPLIGYLLESIREAQVSGEISNRREAIDLAKKILAEEPKKQ